MKSEVGVMCPRVTRAQLNTYLKTTPKSYWQADALTIISSATKGFNAPSWVAELKNPRTTREKVLSKFDKSMCGQCPVPASHFETHDAIFKSRLEMP